MNIFASKIVAIIPTKVLISKKNFYFYNYSSGKFKSA